MLDEISMSQWLNIPRWATSSSFFLSTFSLPLWPPSHSSHLRDGTCYTQSIPLLCSSSGDCYSCYLSSSLSVEISAWKYLKFRRVSPPYFCPRVNKDCFSRLSTSVPPYSAEIFTYTVPVVLGVSHRLISALLMIFWDELVFLSLKEFGKGVISLEARDRSRSCLSLWNSWWSCFCTLMSLETKVWNIAIYDSSASLCITHASLWLFHSLRSRDCFSRNWTFF